jgi:hypothetical protein
MKTSLFIFALLSTIVCGEVRSLDPLTGKAALAGVWEAVPGGDAVGMASAVYRMEIANDAESGDADGSGAIHGKFISRKTSDYPESVDEIFFKRAPWTRDLQQLSKDAERAIEEQRRRPKT